MYLKIMKLTSKIVYFIGIHRTLISIIVALITAFLFTKQTLNYFIILILARLKLNDPKIIESLDKKQALIVKFVILIFFFTWLFRAIIDWFFKYRDNGAFKNYEDEKKAFPKRETDRKELLPTQITQEKADEKRKSIQHVIQIKPDEFDSALRTLRNEGKSDEIIAIFNFVAKHDDKYFIPLKREVAEIAYLTVKIDTAIEAVKAILANKPTNIFALTMMGHCYMYYLNYLEAEKFYNKVRDISESENKPLNTAYALGNLGVVNFRQLKLNQAKRFYEQALKIFEKHKNETNSIDFVKTEVNLGLVLAAQGNPQKAIEIYKNSLEALSKADKREDIASLYCNLGNAYSQLEEYENALEAYMNALDINKVIERKEGIANQYTNMGIVYCRQKKWVDGLKKYREAFSIFREIKSQEGIASTILHIGNVYSSTGKPARAMRLYRCVLSFYEKIGLKKEIASTHVNIANLIYHSDVLDDAINEFKIAEEIYDELAKMQNAAKKELADVKINLGIVYKTKKQHEITRSYWCDALKLYIEIGLSHKERIINDWISKLDN
jgi:tetratricopeptide (TPR) repeat protein